MKLWRSCIVSCIFLPILFTTLFVDGLNLHRSGLSRGRRWLAINKGRKYLKTFGKKSILQGAPSGGSAQTEQPFNGRRLARHIAPISVILVIGSFSVLEILESIREPAERQIGHAHGIAILAFIRLCRSIAILQTQAEEFEERVDEIREEVDCEARGRVTFFSILGKAIISPVFTISACVLATAASLVEIFDDMKPGAHHGAALLALSELYYQLSRLKRFQGRRIAFEKKSPIRRVLSKMPVRMIIALAAAGYAGIEIYEDMQPGAHHGVALLALAELVENMNRSRILRY
jgi:hypothetical protein